MNVVEIVNKIDIKILLFVLALTSLTMFGYNQNSAMKDIALFFAGGIVGYATSLKQA